MLLTESRVREDGTTNEHEWTGDNELGQMMNYLKITGLRLGLILNFKYPKLEWKRVIA